MRRGALRWMKMTIFAELCQFQSVKSVSICVLYSKETAIAIKKMPGAGLKRVILLTTSDLDTAIAILDNTEVNRPS